MGNVVELKQSPSVTIEEAALLTFAELDASTAITAEVKTHAVRARLARLASWAAKQEVAAAVAPQVAALAADVTFALEVLRAQGARHNEQMQAASERIEELHEANRGLGEDRIATGTKVQLATPGELAAITRGKP